ncbi:MAG: hypothetical protein WCQ99_16750 [Pseudomonadota bacterium]
MKSIGKKIVDNIAAILEGALLVSPFAALHIINVMMSPVSKLYLASVR